MHRWSQVSSAFFFFPLAVTMSAIINFYSYIYLQYNWSLSTM